MSLLLVVTADPALHIGLYAAVVAEVLLRALAAANELVWLLQSSLLAALCSALLAASLWLVGH
jgi:hypothetical protein